MGDLVVGIGFSCRLCGLSATGRIEANEKARAFFDAAWAAHVRECRAKATAAAKSLDARKAGIEVREVG